MDWFDDVRSFVSGKICVVTGGGGTIGSALARALAETDVAKIILVDTYEHGVYEVAQDLGDKAVIEIASVRDFSKMEYLMGLYCPNIIFHAAAYKHVPLMENNPEEAVKNNITAVEILIDLAVKYGTDNFIFISTDKAVEPISVMGATKRFSEMIVYEKSLSNPHTKFTTVRFGNVLDSNGSVLPLFRSQVKKGVLTLTDKEVTRYFMTVDEAVRLVLCSLVMARGGEVFIPDMGDEVKISDLAEQVIRGEGKEPYKDVEIKITGLRPGDKLHEKLFYDFEKPAATKYDKIFRVDGSSAEGLMAAIGRLYSVSDNVDADRTAIREEIFRILNQ